MKIKSTTIWQLFFPLWDYMDKGDNTPTKKKKRCFSTPRFSTPSQPSVVPSGCDFVTGVTGVVCVGSSGCDFVTGVTGVVCVGSALDSAPTSGSETHEKHPVNLDLYNWCFIKIYKNLCMKGLLKHHKIMENLISEYLIKKKHRWKQDNSNNQSINQSINQSLKQSATQAINQPTSQAINQASNQSINQINMVSWIFDFMNHSILPNTCHVTTSLYSGRILSCQVMLHVSSETRHVHTWEWRKINLKNTLPETNSSHLKMDGWKTC